MKKPIAKTLAVAMCFVLLLMPVSALDKQEECISIGDFLGLCGVNLTAESEICIEADDEADYLRIVTIESDGGCRNDVVYAFGMVDGELRRVNIIDHSQRIELQTRTSSTVPINIDGKNITITLTSYYTAHSVFGGGVRYRPSGITAKWSRIAGSNTVTSMNMFLAVRGDLYDPDDPYTIEYLDYRYRAKPDNPITNPTMNVNYTASQSLPSDREILPYGGSINEPVMGFSVCIAGYTQTFSYSVYPF